MRLPFSTPNRRRHIGEILVLDLFLQFCLLWLQRPVGHWAGACCLGAGRVPGRQSDAGNLFEKCQMLNLA